MSPNDDERWARHWLDVAGYADSDGDTVSDPERLWAWRYRDYAKRAFYADKPFDRFITEPLAGDELAGSRHGDRTPEPIKLLTATGYLPHGGRWNRQPQVITANRPAKVVNEILA